MSCNAREKFSQKRTLMIIKMSDYISDSLKFVKKNGQFTLRRICIPYITPLYSFTFPVFSNSPNICNLTMKHLRQNLFLL